MHSHKFVFGVCLITSMTVVTADAAYDNLPWPSLVMPRDAASSYNGGAMAVSGDLLLVGGNLRGYPSWSSNAPAALFDLVSGQQLASFEVPEGAIADFGGSVTLSDDYLAIGSYDAVYVYDRGTDNSVWSLSTTLPITPASSQYSSYHDNLEIVGDLLYIGDPEANDRGGQVTVYNLQGHAVQSVILPTEELYENPRTGGVQYSPQRFGYSLDAYGGQIVISAIRGSDDHGSSLGTGLAYLYDLTNEQRIGQYDQSALTSPTGGLGFDVSFDGDRVVLADLYKPQLYDISTTHLAGLNVSGAANSGLQVTMGSKYFAVMGLTTRVNEQDVLLYDRVTGAFLSTLYGNTGFGFLFDGHDLIMSYDDEIAVYDLEFLPGDLDHSDAFDAGDLDYIAERVGTDDMSADIDDSGVVDAADVTALLDLVFDTRPGDANLDLAVDLLDLSLLANHFGQAGGYADGDFNADGMLDLLDLSILATHFGFNNQPSVPAPASLSLLAMGLAGCRRRSTGFTPRRSSD